MIDVASHLTHIIYYIRAWCVEIASDTVIGIARKIYSRYDAEIDSKTFRKT